MGKIEIENIPEEFSKAQYVYSGFTRIFTLVYTPVALGGLLWIDKDLSLETHLLLSLYLIFSISILLPTFFLWKNKIKVETTGITQSGFRKHRYEWSDIIDVYDTVDSKSEKFSYLKFRVKSRKIIIIKGNKKRFAELFESVKDELKEKIYTCVIEEMPEFRHWQWPKKVVIPLFIASFTPLLLYKPLAMILEHRTWDIPIAFPIIIYLIVSLLWRVLNGIVCNNRFIFFTDWFKLKTRYRILWSDVISITDIHQKSYCGMTICYMVLTTTDKTHTVRSMNPDSYKLFSEIKQAFDNQNLKSIQTTNFVRDEII